MDSESRAVQPPGPTQRDSGATAAFGRMAWAEDKIEGNTPADEIARVLPDSGQIRQISAYREELAQALANPATSRLLLGS